MHVGKRPATELAAKYCIQYFVLFQCCWGVPLSGVIWWDLSWRDMCQRDRKVSIFCNTYIEKIAPPVFLCTAGKRRLTICQWAWLCRLGFLPGKFAWLHLNGGSVFRSCQSWIPIGLTQWMQQLLGKILSLYLMWVVLVCSIAIWRRRACLERHLGTTKSCWQFGPTVKLGTKCHCPFCLVWLCHVSSHFSASQMWLRCCPRPQDWETA